VIPDKTWEMEKTYPRAFSEPRYLINLAKLSMKNKEKLVARILVKKFHTKPVDEPRAGEEVRLNPIMKDLIINGYADGSYMQAGKGKRRKRRKTEVKADVVESIGENQPA
jgi:hypothetical protein